MLTLPIENRLAELQRSFAGAIFSADMPIPDTVRSGTGPAHASRFGVYRNNVMASLIGAVAARYPVVRKLLWEDTFQGVARLYVLADPPRSPVLLEYGASFPEFLRRIGQGPAALYLADVAELEAARTRAYHAADATPLDADAFAALAPEHVSALRVTLHPSVTLLQSRFPVVSVWEANRQANDNVLSEWREESALIARPALEVEVRRLSTGAYAFLSALAGGKTVADAVVAASAQDPELELAECFKLLIEARIVIGFEPSLPPDGSHI